MAAFLVYAELVSYWLELPGAQHNLVAPTRRGSEVWFVAQLPGAIRALCWLHIITMAAHHSVGWRSETSSMCLTAHGSPLL